MLSQRQRGFTLIELLVVIAIIAILASILFPVFAKAREKARQTTCLSQVRQMATAVQMYNQDNNGRYPGSAWCAAIAGYLGDSTKMFFCPSDAALDAESPVSYGYAGVLLRADASGVNEAQIKSPTEVGVVCDAMPSKAYPNGGIVAGGGLLDEAANAVVPTARHSKGVIVGYCDGHAKYVPKDFNETDMGNAVTRAFYQANALGLVDNPIGGNSSTAFATGGTITFGGEYAAYPLLQAAADIVKKNGGTYYTRGYLGENATVGRPASDYVWGGVTTSAVSTARIGQDCLVLIVAKSSKLPGIGTLTNSTYQVSTATLQGWVTSSAGFADNSIQTYTLGANSQTRTQLNNAWFGFAANDPMGTKAVQVANDVEMVDKVSNDPYALGYCSSVFADPERVVILTHATPADTAFPQANPKYRWTMPSGGPSGFFTRSIVATGVGAGTAVEVALESGSIKTTLQAGVLFKCSYWP